MLGKAQWKYMQAKTVTEMGVTLEYRYMYDPIKNYLVQPRIIHFCRRNKDMQEEKIKAAESAPASGVLTTGMLLGRPLGESS